MGRTTKESNREYMRNYRANKKAAKLGVPLAKVMSTATPILKWRCSICEDPARLEMVSTMVAEGRSIYAIRERSRDPGAIEIGVTPMKEGTIKRHLTLCPKAKAKELVASIRVTHDREGNEALTTRPYVPRTYAPQPETLEEHVEQRVSEVIKAPPTDSNDLAVAIRDAVAEKMKNGEVRLTAQHGLLAQQMLDRRLEKQKDRELALIVGRMLTAAPPPAGVLPARNVTPLPMVSEGEYEELG